MYNCMHVASKVTFWRARSSKGSFTLQVHLGDFAEQPTTNRQHEGAEVEGGIDWGPFYIRETSSPTQQLKQCNLKECAASATAPPN